ncbi:MAG: carbohydrate ABC transporter permease [Bacilli bacterium]|jgi:ABC-type glycerol-3-phosphate transport system permease component
MFYNRLKRNYRSKTTPERILFSVVFIIFCIYAISLILPFIWAFLSSLKTDDEFYESLFDLPRNWLFSNYAKAFSEFRIGNTTMIGMIINSLWLTFAGTFVSVMVSSATGYIFAKYPFKGSKLIYDIAIISMIIPIVGSLPATYKVVTTLHLNTPLTIIALYTGGFGYNFIILNSCYRSISWHYAEASMIDGAGHFRTYLKVMLPQAKPAILAMAILSCIGIWNDYYTPFLYLKDYPTLALGIYQFDIIQEQRSNMPVYFCAIILSIIPVLIVYTIFQDTIMNNSVAGGLKG